MTKHPENLNCRWASPAGSRGGVSRRGLLQSAAHGFGALSLAALWQQAGWTNPAAQESSTSPQLTGGILQEFHHPPRARNVIFLYMDGGPSQVDTFDYKPQLKQYEGRDPNELFRVEPTQFNNVGKMLPSPWNFVPCGQSGRMISDLFPHIRKHADDLTFIHSMTSRFSEHTFANYFLHTGNGQQGRPSHGAWINYGLGSAAGDLPGFVVLDGGLIPPGGVDCFGSGFLPAAYQASVFKSGPLPLANIRPNEKSESLQAAKLQLLRSLDGESLSASGSSNELEAAIVNYELAARMQVAIPRLADLSGETAATHKMYGLDAEFENTRVFGGICLLARRLVEQGVRFIELTCPAGNGDRWDQHGNLRDGHEKNARSVDQPIAALLTDLKQRGLLETTLVVWCGEFGRTPFAQGSDGRDHNPFGFTIWLAGGGVRAGVAHGATDEFGYVAVENKLEIFDLHATILHLLGIDHTRLTFRFGGRDMRLTDVHGNVIREILA